MKGLSVGMGIWEMHYIIASCVWSLFFSSKVFEAVVVFSQTHECLMFSLVETIHCPTDTVHQQKTSRMSLELEILLFLFLALLSHVKSLYNITRLHVNRAALDLVLIILWLSL